MHLLNNKKSPASLLLEDGTFLQGSAIGQIGTTTGELCFNTGMTGYQEIYTDPSYYGQLIINTTTHIGNYGTLAAENESDRPKFSGLICREFSEVHSRLSAHESLQDYFKRFAIVGITDVDTRALVRHLRYKGAMNAVISSEVLEKENLHALLDQVPSMAGLELSSEVSTTLPYELGQGSTRKVAVLDLGIKKSILQNLAVRNMHVKVFPAKSTFEEMQQWNPDGYFISNGPGDPAAMPYAVQNVSKIIESNTPLFGICLGHQILCLSQGLKTFKMHHGHRGLNHPVQNLIKNKSEVTSQNHGFCVSAENLKNHPEVLLTHVNLNDESVEGVMLKNRPAFSVQYHPEASPGPHDSRYLFDQFSDNISNHLNQ